jgi:hypothetical protein
MVNETNSTGPANPKAVFFDICDTLGHCRAQEAPGQVPAHHRSKDRKIKRPFPPSAPSLPPHLAHTSLGAAGSLHHGDQPLR